MAGRADKDRERAAKREQKKNPQNELMSKANINRLRGQASAAGKAGAEARRKKIDENDYSAGYNRAKQAETRARNSGDKAAEKAAKEQKEAFMGMLSDLGLNVKGEPKKPPGRVPRASADTGMANACPNCQAKQGQAHMGWCSNR